MITSVLSSLYPQVYPLSWGNVVGALCRWLLAQAKPGGRRSREPEFEKLFKNSLISLTFAVFTITCGRGSVEYHGRARRAPRRGSGETKNANQEQLGGPWVHTAANLLRSAHAKAKRHQILAHVEVTSRVGERHPPRHRPAGGLVGDKQ